MTTDKTVRDNKGLLGIAKSVEQLKGEFDALSDDKESLFVFYEKLSTIVTQLVTDDQLIKVIGYENSSSLRNSLITLSTKMADFRNATELGFNSKKDELAGDIMAMSRQLVRKLGDIRKFTAS